MPRQTYEPTEKQRSEVKAMAGYGIPHAMICDIVGIAEKTLRKHFASELRVGKAQASTKVAQTLFNIAVGNLGTDETGKTIKPDPKAQMSALIYWTKSQMGWRETEKPNVDGGNGITVTIKGGFTDG